MSILGKYAVELSNNGKITLYLFRQIKPNVISSYNICIVLTLTSLQTKITQSTRMILIVW